MDEQAVASFDTAPQHGPRPLPLFLAMLHQNGAASPERVTAALAGLRAYQSAPRDRSPDRHSVHATVGRARMLDYGGGAAVGPPIVLVPSLINPHTILDLDEQVSLARFLALAGHRVFLIDWGTPSPADRDQSLGDHVQSLLVPLLARLERPPVLVGYCLGGTLALAAAMLHPVAAVALIAAPWRFGGYSDRARADIASGWRDSQAACDALGLVPMEVLQAGFWRIDPDRTIDKYIRFATLPPESDATRQFVVLEDWANAGAPLTLAAGRELFDDLIGHDLPGTGRWRVGECVVDPAAIECPMIEFISTSDRIVPAASAIGLSDQRRLTAGHVGMVVGSRAREQLWQPLSDWLSALPIAR